ncbi:hypothetical protein ACCO45_005683 [Purpureocillium lilacinum]|uniref:Uncharacterized protein n=1 Tax=Purpureocillium lilacinum TaxID=33203 RepID=A0ACC4DYS3_PURLI
MPTALRPRQGKGARFSRRCRFFHASHQQPTRVAGDRGTIQGLGSASCCSRGGHDIDDGSIDGALAAPAGRMPRVTAHTPLRVDVAADAPAACVRVLPASPDGAAECAVDDRRGGTSYCNHPLRRLVLGRDNGMWDWDCFTLSVNRRCMAVADPSTWRAMIVLILSGTTPGRQERVFLPSLSDSRPLVLLGLGPISTAGMAAPAPHTRAFSYVRVTAGSAQAQARPFDWGRR